MCAMVKTTVEPGSGPPGWSQHPAVAWLLATPMRHPNLYVWFVFVSAMDIMLTWIILFLGGDEVNPIAAAVIERWDLPGAIAFKFGLMMFVIAVCELVATQRPRMSRQLARLAVVASAFPVAYSLALLTYHFTVTWPGV